MFPTLTSNQGATTIASEELTQQGVRIIIAQQVYTFYALTTGFDCVFDSCVAGFLDVFLSSTFFLVVGQADS